MQLHFETASLTKKGIDGVHVHSSGLPEYKLNVAYIRIKATSSYFCLPKNYWMC